jgi:hypothetical protein
MSAPTNCRIYVDEAVLSTALQHPAELRYYVKLQYNLTSPEVLVTRRPCCRQGVPEGGCREGARNRGQPLDAFMRPHRAGAMNTGRGRNQPIWAGWMLNLSA